MSIKGTITTGKAAKGAKKETFAESFTNEIINQLESGDIKEWRKTWAAVEVNPPKNGESERAYKLVNAYKLLRAASIGGFTDSRWYTFKQIQKIDGAKIRKGEHGVKVLGWFPAKGQEVEIDDEFNVTIKEKEFAGIRPRVYVLFNAQQCDGIQPAPQTFTPPEWSGIERIEKLIKNCGAVVNTSLIDLPFHVVDKNTIGMPPASSFNDECSYYASLLHELVHFTGAKSRLNRPHDSEDFFSESKAREELIAEIGAAMLCGVFGIEQGEIDKNHAAYIKSWLSFLKDDKNEIIKAAREAEKAVTWILQHEDGAAIDITPAAAKTEEKEELKKVACQDVRKPIIKGSFEIKSKVKKTAKKPEVAKAPEEKAPEIKAAPAVATDETAARLEMVSEALKVSARVKKAVSAWDGKVCNIKFWAAMKEAGQKGLSEKYVISAGVSPYGNARIDIQDARNYDRRQNVFYKYDVKNFLKEEAGKMPRIDAAAFIAILEDDEKRLKKDAENIKETVSKEAEIKAAISKMAELSQFLRSVDAETIKSQKIIEGYKIDRYLNA